MNRSRPPTPGHREMREARRGDPAGLLRRCAPRNDTIRLHDLSNGSRQIMRRAGYEFDYVGGVLVAPRLFTCTELRGKRATYVDPENRTTPGPATITE